MKLLFISRFIPYIGGREVILQSILHKLSKNHQVYLLTPDRGYFTRDFTIFNFKYLQEIPRLINKIRPDIINIHTFYFTRSVLLISRKLDIPVILTLHGLFLNQYGEKYLKFFEFIKNCFKNHNFFITVVCRHHKKQLENFGMSPKKIYVIRNGINPERFTYIKNFSKRRLKKDLYLSQSSKIILTVARFIPLKGLDYLIKACSILKFKNFMLLISTPTGRYNKEDMKYRDSLLEYAQKLGCKNRIIIQLHDHESMPLIYKSCDLFVLPSINEGLPLSILEAMACNLLTVASNVGGISEIIKDGKTGFLVKSKNYKNMASVIKKSLNLNKAKKRRIVQNAKKTLINNFSEKQMIDQYQKLFLDIKNK
ncbi:MAG: glycosyltransferase family 4 protein, partial [Promethearchaeota archaeon]